MGPGREIELLHCLFKKERALSAHHAVLAHHHGAHIRVGSDLGNPLKAVALKRATRTNTASDRGRRLTLLVRRKLLVIDLRYFDVQIDPI
jgi:hypothetical protein